MTRTRSHSRLRALLRALAALRRAVVDGARDAGNDLAADTL